MTDDPIDFDIVVTRKPQPEREILFVCLLCEKEIETPTRWQRASFRPHEREPICNACTRRWGSVSSNGPVFNRQNYHTLRQFSAITNCLTWEIQNGNRRYR